MCASYSFFSVLPPRSANVDVDDFLIKKKQRLLEGDSECSFSAKPNTEFQIKESDLDMHKV